MNIKITKTTTIIVVVGTLAGGFLFTLGLSAFGGFFLILALGYALAGSTLAFKLDNDSRIAAGEELLFNSYIQTKAAKERATSIKKVVIANAEKAIKRAKKG